MAMTIFKIFSWKGISLDIRWKIIFTAPLTHCLKTNFRRYTRRYACPNENFEYSYPLDIYILSVAALHKSVGKLFKILGYAKDLCK